MLASAVRKTRVQRRMWKGCMVCRVALSGVFLRGIVGEYESWKHATGRELEDKAGKMEKAIVSSDRGRRNECMVFTINES